MTRHEASTRRRRARAAPAFAPPRGARRASDSASSARAFAVQTSSPTAAGDARRRRRLAPRHLRRLPPRSTAGAASRACPPKRRAASAESARARDCDRARHGRAPARVAATGPLFDAASTAETSFCVRRPSLGHPVPPPPPPPRGPLGGLSAVRHLARPQSFALRQGRAASTRSSPPRAHDAQPRTRASRAALDRRSPCVAGSATKRIGRAAAFGAASGARAAPLATCRRVATRRRRAQARLLADPRRVVAVARARRS